jgi:hypothetical protein
MVISKEERLFVPTLPKDLLLLKANAKKHKSGLKKAVSESGSLDQGSRGSISSQNSNESRRSSISKIPDRNTLVHQFV